MQMEWESGFVCALQSEMLQKIKFPFTHGNRKQRILVFLYDSNVWTSTTKIKSGLPQNKLFGWLLLTLKWCFGANA